MELRIHGTFLITGETAPLGRSLRNAIEVGIARVLRNTKAHAARAHVTLAEMIGPHGGIHKRCRISVRLNGAESLIAEDVGPTARVASQRAIDRVARTIGEATGRCGEEVCSSASAAVCA